MKKVIELINASFKDIINDVNFCAYEGECIAIIGNSGAGKSTLLNIMSGIERPDKGDVIVNDTLLNKLREPSLTRFRSKNMSYIFQDYKLIDYLTVDENIKLIEENNKNTKCFEKMDKIKKTLGLSNKGKNVVKTLSGGEKQRVSIARSLIGDSKIIFADEPTGALDIVNKDAVLKLLVKNSKMQNKTLILVTHDPEIALAAEKIYIVWNKTIEEIKDKDNLRLEDIKKEIFKRNNENVVS